MKTIHVEYYAMLREQRGSSAETIETMAGNATELYAELIKKHSLRYPVERLKVAVNDEFAEWKTALKNRDRVAFIPPVSGG